MTSIRRRLLWGMLVGIGALQLIALFAAYGEIDDQVDDLFDVQLKQAAYAIPRLDLMTFAGHGGEEDGDMEDSLDQLVVEVRKPGMVTPIYHSRSEALLPPDAAAGWSTVAIGGQGWRLYRAAIDGRSVEVAQPLAVREDAVNDIAVDLLLPLGAVLPLAAILIWFGVGRGLGPLIRTAQDIRRRSHTDLTPLETAGQPEELAPLVNALNDLMARLERALAAQKDFVADAAHELLTPLTALQLQAQLMERANDSEQRASALSELRTGLSRGIHLARQLLMLARQEPENQLQVRPIDLQEIIRHTLGTHAALASSRGVDLGMGDCADAVVTGDAETLVILLGNLVDNAIKYTPQGGQVDVRVFHVDGECVLRVEDSGPGIPPEDLKRVFDRFFRRPGQAATGSGLGLAIARNIAERQGATLNLRNGSALGGLIAECRWSSPPTVEARRPLH